MRLKNFLIVVKDIERARKYYEDVFGLVTLRDFDGNMIMTGGLVLQQENYWRDFLDADVVPRNNSCELYFEHEDVEEFVSRLKKLYPQTEFVNELMTHDWGQTVVRFYDLDGNLIEVGSPF